MKNLWIICLGIFLTEIGETSITNSLESATYLRDTENTIVSTDITSSISTSKITTPSTDASTITTLPTSMTSTNSIDTTTPTKYTDTTTPTNTDTTTPTTTDKITPTTLDTTTPTITDTTTDIITSSTSDTKTPTTTDTTTPSTIDTATPTNTYTTTPTTTDTATSTTTDTTTTTDTITSSTSDTTTPTTTDTTTPTTTDTTTPTTPDTTTPTITDTTTPTTTDTTTPTTTDTTTPTTPDTTTPTITDTTTPTTTTPRPYYLGSENITWNPRYAEDLIVTTDEGYKIAATIKECNFEENEFCTFSTDFADETVMMAKYVNQNTSVFWNRNILYAHFNGTSASSLTVIFSKIGEEVTTTTTELTTTTEFLPTPTANDSYELTVHLTGLDPYKYGDPKILLSFKEMISSMAREYCQNHNFELIDEITSNNVKISEIIRCYNGWPTCNPCVEVTFAVPINMKENSFWSGYQLNSANLQIMWDKYSQRYLGMGITTCEEPNINSWIKWNIIAISVVTGIVLILLLILRYYINKKAKDTAKSNRLMNDVAPVSVDDERIAADELPPHYLQEMPKLFDNAYPMYNPDG